MFPTLWWSDIEILEKLPANWQNSDRWLLHWLCLVVGNVTFNYPIIRKGETNTFFVFSVPYVNQMSEKCIYNYLTSLNCTSTVFITWTLADYCKGLPFWSLVCQISKTFLLLKSNVMRCMYIQLTKKYLYTQRIYISSKHIYVFITHL